MMMRDGIISVHRKNETCRFHAILKIIVTWTYALFNGLDQKSPIPDNPNS
jgi:hypothetical protein